MEKQLQIFTHEEFGQVRVIEIDGAPWFVASDVCRVLELGNPSQALSRLDDDEKGLHFIPATGIISKDTHGGQEMLVINESGLYSMILRSNLPKAREFKHWVTSEVLPSIHKTGSYSKDAVSMLLGKDLRPACVYALKLSDGTVKIGVTRNLKKRIKGVARTANLQWLNVYHTSFAPFSFMRSLLKKCHEAFADKWVSGEFFAAEFDDVCKELDRHKGKIESALAFYEEGTHMPL